jgi:Secretion system C-terminal sorting domain/Cleaved Adhesin Domain
MMKKLLLLLVLSSFGAKAQTVLFEDSFEFNDDFAIANIANGWTLLDVDLKNTYGFSGITFPNSGVPKSFQVFNATTTTPALTPTTTSNWTARTGDKHMVCFAASTAPPVNNDWLISPQITLGSTGNVLSFWAKACDGTYSAEKFSVWVSTTGTAPANFTQISSGTFTTTPSINWLEYTYSLSASYNNLPIYIGIKCVSDDQFGFAVDDFKVTTTGLKNNEFFSSNFSIQPNPVNDVFTLTTKNGVAIEKVEVLDINGRVVNQVNGSSTDAIQVNVSELNSGVYFVKVQSDLGVGTSKIIKK